MKEKIINIATGEETWRDYTAKEVAEAQAEAEKIKELVKVIEAKKLARQSALAKLAALGLSEEEIAAL